MQALLLYRRLLFVSLLGAASLTTALAAEAQTVQELEHLKFHPAPYPLQLGGQVARRDGRVLLASAEGSLAGLGLDEAPSIESYRAKIEEREAREGPFAPALFEDLLSLGLLLQEAQAHEDALAVLERAAALSRMDDGLYAPQQVSLTEHIIDSLIATDAFDEVVARQEYLVHLQRQLHGSEAPQTALAMQHLGEWKLQAFHRRLLEPVTGQQMLMARDPGVLYTGYQVYDDSFAELLQAQENFITAIRVLIENGDFANPALYQLEQNLLKTLFINANRELVISDPRHYALQDENSFASKKNRKAQRRVPEDYQKGEQSYLRQIGYLKQNDEATVQQLAQVMLGLADWHLMFGKYQEAEEQYSRIEGLLGKAGFDQAAIDAIMRPTVPATLPGFMDTAISAPLLADTRQYKGHVDVALKLNRYGRVGGVEVLGSTEGTSEHIEARLVSLVRHAQFRPTPGRSTTTGIRYYYTY